MTEDIRDKPFIRHDDVIGLNFIRPGGRHVFRRHSRQGLRSHIMEILAPCDVTLENTGTVVDGVRFFPRARPANMLRIFRTRLETLASALAEIARVNLVARHLGPDYIAASSEFVVDYHGPHGTGIMLCGLQAFVAGEILDPWSLLDAAGLLPDLYQSLHRPGERSQTHRQAWIGALRDKTAGFVRAIKQMIADEQHIPDLAGVGNLVVPVSGAIKLVDINNISRVAFDGEIRLDDKGYPVCDKSIEALSLIEQKILGRRIDLGEAVYRFFLDPERMRRVAAREDAFFRGGAP